jgi:2-oxoisovalerate dehydrogenase E1 component
MGSLNLPAVPIHSELEKEMLPSADKLKSKIRVILDY